MGLKSKTYSDIITIGSNIRNASSDPVIDTSGSSRQSPNIRQCLNVIRIITQRTIIRIRWVMFVEELFDKFSLIIGYWIDVTESATGRIIDRVWVASGIVYGWFGVVDGIARVNFRGPDGCYVGTRIWPCRVEDVEIRSETTGRTIDIPGIVYDLLVFLSEEKESKRKSSPSEPKSVLTWNARITRGEEEWYSLKPQFHILETLPLLICNWEVGFLSTVWQRNHVGRCEGTTH